MAVISTHVNAVSSTARRLYTSVARQRSSSSPAPAHNVPDVYAGTASNGPASLHRVATMAPRIVHPKQVVFDLGGDKADMQCLVVVDDDVWSLGAAQALAVTGPRRF